MASPISFGDAYQLAKLALRLGRAFTSGRKSAPAEFQEVDDLLYSLSAALSALDSATKLHGPDFTIDPQSLPRSSNQQPTGAEDVVNSMLKSCKDILDHLNELVEKYGSIRRPVDADFPMLKRWSKEIKQNWKKIQWTTEGGGLATLRSQLTVHTNSLNLLLGVINNSQGHRVEGQVGQVTIMLKEIHTWFIENIKNMPASSEFEQVARMDSSQLIQPANFQFHLYEERPSGPELLCSQASLHSDLRDRSYRSDPTDYSQPRALFRCNCSDESASHAIDVDAFRLSRLSFAVRLAGKERAWKLYKAASGTSNKTVSLVIKHVPNSRIGEFETDFIHGLSLRAAKSMIRRDMGTILAYVPASEEAASSEARVLNLTVDMALVQKKVESVTFKMSRQTYTRSGIQDIQMLHYKILRIDDLFHGSGPTMNDITQLGTAEILIFFIPQDEERPKDDAGSLKISLKRNTKIKNYASEAEVILTDVECSVLDADEQGISAEAMDVSFKLATPEASSTFTAVLEEMRMELFIISLKSPRLNEKVVLKLQARGVHTEEIDFGESEISIVQNTQTESLRLIIVTKNGCLILSQELAKDFMNGPRGRPNFGSLTYVMQIENTGIQKVSRYKKGFEYFDFSDVQYLTLLLPSDFIQITSQAQGAILEHFRIGNNCTEN